LSKKRWAVLAAGVTAGVTAAVSLSAAMPAVAAAMAAGRGTVAAGQGSMATSSPSWRIVKQLRNGTEVEFTAVTAAGRNGGWAFETNFASGGRPQAWERRGSGWSQVAFPGQADEQVVAASATSASDVWAFTVSGTHSRALRWNGSKWLVTGNFTHQVGGDVVLGPADVWVFGVPFVPGAGLGAWHYNGRGWSRVAGGNGLEGGSAVSAHDVWAFAGSNVAHWNGRNWTRTSVARLLPARQALNGPAVTGIYAQSATSVYAIGNGNLQDEGGPVVVLHYNGHAWSRVAQGNYGFGTQPVQQIAADGHRGLWLPMPGVLGAPSYLLDYAGGRLTKAGLPAPASKINVDAVSAIPGTSDDLATGFTHAAGNLGSNVSAVILEYAR